MRKAEAMGGGNLLPLGYKAISLWDTLYPSIICRIQKTVHYLLPLIKGQQSAAPRAGLQI